jgi:hypothetical protein
MDHPETPRGIYVECDIAEAFITGGGTDGTLAGAGDLARSRPGCSSVAAGGAEDDCIDVGLGSTRIPTSEQAA